VAIGLRACERLGRTSKICARTVRLGQAAKAERKRIKDPERDLARKGRALAETAALRVLRKKASAIRGDEAQSGARQIRPSGGRLDAPNEDA
jgi:hypothetical protein